MKSGADISSSPRFLRCEFRPHKGHDGDAGNLDGILERQEKALGRPLFRIHIQNVFTIQRRASARHLIAVATGQHIGQGRFAGAIRPHDCVDLAFRHVQRQAIDDRLGVIVFTDSRGQVFNLQHGAHVSSLARCEKPRMQEMARITA